MIRCGFEIALFRRLESQKHVTSHLSKRTITGAYEHHARSSGNGMAVDGTPIPFYAVDCFKILSCIELEELFAVSELNTNRRPSNPPVITAPPTDNGVAEKP